jgi:hypothetical protein
MRVDFNKATGLAMRRSGGGRSDGPWLRLRPGDDESIRIGSPPDERD